ncbi:MAG: twin-arginine translocase TatA/TatE family subunit [Calditrichaceae bacterium]|nr:twin-arginine translocase TatA/TatE family subunit [Calditrichaceae bacterium]
MHFGLTEILIIAGIIVLLFGARKLPELAKGLGSSIKEFKKGLDNKEDEPKP